MAAIVNYKARFETATGRARDFLTQETLAAGEPVLVLHFTSASKYPIGLAAAQLLVARLQVAGDQQKREAGYVECPSCLCLFDPVADAAKYAAGDALYFEEGVPHDPAMCEDCQRKTPCHSCGGYYRDIDRDCAECGCGHP